MTITPKAERLRLHGDLDNSLRPRQPALGRWIHVGPRAPLTLFTSPWSPPSAAQIPCKAQRVFATVYVSQCFLVNGWFSVHLCHYTFEPITGDLQSAPPVSPPSDTLPSIGKTTTTPFKSPSYYILLSTPFNLLNLHRFLSLPIPRGIAWPPIHVVSYFIYVQGFSSFPVPCCRCVHPSRIDCPAWVNIESGRFVSTTLTYFPPLFIIFERQGEDISLLKH